MSIFGTAKKIAKAGVDKAKDLAVQAALNHLLGDIGSISDLVIDRVKQRITGQLTLNGEKESIEITIAGWDFGDATAPNRVRGLSLTSNRPWLNAIAARAVVNRWFDVPPAHMGKLKTALS